MSPPESSGGGAPPPPSSPSCAGTGVCEGPGAAGAATAATTGGVATGSEDTLAAPTFLGTLAVCVLVATLRLFAPLLLLSGGAVAGRGLDGARLLAAKSLFSSSLTTSLRSGGILIGLGRPGVAAIRDAQKRAVAIACADRA